MKPTLKRSPRTLLWLLIAGLATALLVAAGRWLAQSGDWVEIDVPSSLHGEALRDPLHAAKQLARQLGASVSAPTRFEHLPPEGATLVLASPRWNMFPGRAAALGEWVERGGRLVLLQSALSERTAPPWLPLRLTPMRKPTGTAGDANLPSPDDDDDEPASEDPAASAAPHASEPESPVPPGIVPGRFVTPCPYYREPAEAPVFAFGEQRSFQVCGRASRRLLGQRGAEWRIDAPDGSVAMRVLLGRGSVTANAIEGAFGNESLLRHDAPLAFAAMLQLRAGDVVWFIDDERRARFLALLWSAGWPALLLAAAATLLALWRGGVRFGPLIAEVPRARRSIGEQVRRTAAFIAAGGGTTLHRAAVRALEEQARRSVPNYHALVTVGERSGAIARQVGGDAAALASAMAAPAPAVRRPALTAAIANVEHARRALLHARSKPLSASPSSSPPSSSSR